MIIEGLVPDPRRPGSTRVVVEGRPAWTVPADIVGALSLVVGTPLRGAIIEELDRAADEEGAFRAGLRALERRGHARQELLRRLERKGHPLPAASAALARLEALGLIDDVAFATNYAATRGERGRGPARLRRDLAALGVERTVIDRAIAAATPEHDDPMARARALASRRASQLRGLPRDTRRRRLTAFLARRGYGGSDARTVVDAVLRGDPE